VNAIRDRVQYLREVRVPHKLRMNQIESKRHEKNNEKMGKKSAAQLRRLEKRAAQRGETYVPPFEEPTQPADNNGVQDNDQSKEENKSSINTSGENTIEKRRTIAHRLKKELQEIEANTNLVSKDRRSAKRKAEAIAAEESGMPVSELMEWLGTNSGNHSASENTTEPKRDAETARKIASAEKLLKEFETIDGNQEMKSKDRRSAKRKAEAICTEETAMSTKGLLEWYKTKKHLQETKKVSSKKGSTGRRRDPLIAFFGQLSYETTSEELMEHICTNLVEEYPKAKSMTRIRLLTDPKTKRSKGMAFVEVDDPEFLYALLKLHQTYLNGRRINVERSAGGKKHSEVRKSKLERYKQEQGEYFAEVVDKILSEYKTTGELREDELDEGVVTVCKRHSGPVVRAAVAEYIEKGGKDMNNPSAYLTFLVTKFAKEGIHDVEDTGRTKKRKETSSSSSRGGDRKRTKEWKGASEFSRSGVDMSASDRKEGSGKRDLSSIFPSSQRGRGRGYMSNVRR